MKKFISVFLCLVMMLTFVPTVMASAAPVAVAEETEAPAEGGESGGGLDLGGLDLSWLGDFWKLITGLFDQIGGETIITTIKTFFAKFLEVVSLGEFFDSIKAIWNDVK
ncbi:MAG: hypothetical protein IJB86_08230 [Clostridia bacterium]|nr:hypothetical protein [Clostridia bacterium]